MKNVAAPVRPALIHAPKRWSPKYVPALILKDAERVALASLKDGSPEYVYPLLTVLRVPKATSRIDERTGERKVKPAPSLAEHLQKQHEIIREILTPSLLSHGVDRAMIDVGHLDKQQGKSTLAALDKSLDAGVKRDLVPVVAVDQIDAHVIAARRWDKNYTTGFALRFRRTARSRELPEGGWPSTSAGINVLRQCGGRPDCTDLILDVANVRGEAINRHLEELAGLVREFTALGQWRTVTVLAGAFPRSIGELDFDVYHQLVRWDFVLWKRLKRDLTLDMCPDPAFGDYAMVFPVPADGGSLPQANLRYTDERVWRVYRRESDPAMRTICKLMRDERWFRGAEFSCGDEWIHNVAENRESPGNGETWIRTGLQHHLAFVVQQLLGNT